MIIKPALAAMIASGLIIPEKPKLVFSKPAIVKSENLDFLNNKHLAMPLTMGMLARTPKVTYSYRTSVSSATNSSSYSFASTDIGTAANNRYIVVVGFASHASNASPSISSCTVGGAATTRLVNNAGSSANGNFCAIFITNSAVTSGTTATIDLTTNAEAIHASASIYAVYGLNSTTAVDTGAVTSSTLSDTLTVTAGGVVIAGARSASAYTTTWTNLNENVDTTLESRVYSAASDVTPTTGTLTVTAAFSTSSSTAKLVAVSLR